MKQRVEVHQREESKERGEEEENNKGKMVLTKGLFFPSEPENKILGCSSDFIFLKNEELKFQRKTNSGEPNKGKERFRNSLPVEVHFLPTSCEPNMALVLAEFGKNSRDEGFSVGVRDSFMNKVYGQTYNLAKDGGTMAASMVWQLMAQDMAGWDDGYSIVLPENPSTAAVISAQSHAMAELAHHL